MRNQNPGNHGISPASAPLDVHDAFVHSSGHVTWAPPCFTCRPTVQRPHALPREVITLQGLPRALYAHAATEEAHKQPLLVACRQASTGTCASNYQRETHVSV